MTNEQQPARPARAVESAEEFASAWCKRAVNPGAWQVMRDNIITRDTQIHRTAVQPFIDALSETIGLWCNHEPGDTRCAPIHAALDAAITSGILFSSCGSTSVGSTSIG